MGVTVARRRRRTRNGARRSSGREEGPKVAVVGCFRRSSSAKIVLARGSAAFANAAPPPPPPTSRARSLSLSRAVHTHTHPFHVYFFPSPVSLSVPRAASRKVKFKASQIARRDTFLLLFPFHGRSFRLGFGNCLIERPAGATGEERGGRNGLGAGGRAGKTRAGEWRRPAYAILLSSPFLYFRFSFFSPGERYAADG